MALQRCLSTPAILCFCYSVNRQVDKENTEIDGNAVMYVNLSFSCKVLFPLEQVYYFGQTFSSITPNPMFADRLAVPEGTRSQRHKTQ